MLAHDAGPRELEPSRAAGEVVPPGFEGGRYGAYRRQAQNREPDKTK
jgi:hypothetical protein